MPQGLTGFTGLTLHLIITLRFLLIHTGMIISLTPGE